ncbi:MAG: glycosyltransferase family 4 protein [Lentisphaeria bacterium]|nr:glycosyltransferase family 4 protein [Lentisphaeria bacterium]
MASAEFKVLYISERAGFAGGVERFIFRTAGLLRDAGMKVYGRFGRPDRDAAAFARNFDGMFQPDELPAADLAVIHRIDAPEALERLLDRYGSRLALYVHDHDYYCPRTYRYTPFGRGDCRRPYALVRCGACAMLTSPRRWRNGFFGEFAARTVRCRRRLELLREVRQVAVLSEFMRRNLIANGFAPERVTVIPPPVEIPDTLPERPENTPPRLLFTGQLIRGKGVDQLLRALPLLHRDYRLAIAGEGNQRPELERLANRLGVADKVSFLGWVAEPEALCAASDIAVLPFFWQEPFGLVGPEALARGVPVVAFRQGGVDEWLVDGENGLAVPPRDITRFAAAVDRLLADRSLRHRLGGRGRESVRKRFADGEFVRRFRAWAEGGRE